MNRVYKNDGILYTFDPPVTASVKDENAIFYVVDIFVPFDSLRPISIICFDVKKGCFFRGSPYVIKINEMEIFR